MNHIMIYDIPGSSKCVKFVPFHPKNLPKNRNFTYMEDPGIHHLLNLQVPDDICHTFVACGSALGSGMNFEEAGDAISSIANQCNTCIPTSFFGNLLDKQVETRNHQPSYGYGMVLVWNSSPQVSTCERSSQWAWPPVKRW